MKESRRKKVYINNSLIYIYHMTFDLCICLGHGDLWPRSAGVQDPGPVPVPVPGQPKEGLPLPQCSVSITTFLVPLGHHYWALRTMQSITVRAPVFGRYQNSAPQSITEMPMEYHLDEWFVMTPYVAGLLHPAIISHLITIILLKEVWK